MARAPATAPAASVELVSPAAFPKRTRTATAYGGYVDQPSTHREQLAYGTVGGLLLL